MEYTKGSYNKFNDTEQWIRLSEGCPNQCEYCRESSECGIDPVYFDIPELVRNNVKIMDMNLIYKPRSIEIIEELGRRRVNGKCVYYELICGIDYRFMTQEHAIALRQARFKNIRLAWDHSFGEQKKIKSCIKLLINAGYKPRDITVFMICNWKIPYESNLRKVDLCKVWNVKVADCWFDNQLSPNIDPIHWKREEIIVFRRIVRQHNQLVGFGIDPEYKGD